MKKHTILVVDSDLLRGKVLTEELKLQGYHCLQAMQIPQAENFLFSFRPACVILTLGERSQIGEAFFNAHLMTPTYSKVRCVLIAAEDSEVGRPGDVRLSKSEPLHTLKGKLVQACATLLGTQSKTAPRGKRYSSYVKTGEHDASASTLSPGNNAQSGSPSHMRMSNHSPPPHSAEPRTSTSLIGSMSSGTFVSDARPGGARSGGKSTLKATMQLSALRGFSFDDKGAEEVTGRPSLSWGLEEDLNRVQSNRFAEMEESLRQKYLEVMTQDYFVILGLTPSSPAHQVRTAYQNLRRTFSEERFPPSLLETRRNEFDEITQTLQEAFEVLSEPRLRELYTQRLKQR